MRYEIIKTNTIEDMEKAVNKLLGDGWRCQGGISVISLGDGWRSYHQAMIKEVP